MRLSRVHGGGDGARRDGVDADAARGVLDGQRPGGGLEAALGQRGQHGRDARVGVVDQAGGDVDDVAAALGEHVLDGELGDVEEAVEVHRGHGGVVVGGVVGERLGDEDACVVDQGVDPAEPFDGRLRRPFGGGAVGDVALHCDDAGVVGGGDRAGDRDDGVTEPAVRLDEAGSDALRRAGDERDLLTLVVHDDLLRCFW